MRQWHYVLSAEQKGPIPEDQLLAMLGSGELARDTLVWTPGLEKWTPAAEVQALPLYHGLLPPPPAAEAVSAPKPTSKALSAIASIVGAAIGYFAVKAMPFDLTVRLFAGGFAGLLCGLIPYFIAKKRNNLKLAQLALGICILCGAILGLILAVPVCLAFVIIALATKRGE